jgi:hypothetical protein
MRQPAKNQSTARNILWLVFFFVLALIPRLYSAQSVGMHWDYAGSFTLINFDEGGSCRAALKGFEYSTFIGQQTIAITEALGYPVASGTVGDYKAAKKYCHSRQHILVARAYSAITGALTVVLIGIIGLLLVPSRPQVAWTAAGLLALSGFHVSESHSGTVDAPSVFFVYAFLTSMVFAVVRKSLRASLVSPLLLVPAIWAKYWVFAMAGYIVLLSQGTWNYLSRGLTAARVAVLLLAAVVTFALASNAAFQAAGLFPLLALFYLLVPWRAVNRLTAFLLLLIPFIAYGLTKVGVIADYTTGGMESRFGTGYAAIGWNKFLRNPVNVFAVLVLGLGLPACLFIPAGIRAIVSDGRNARAWLCFAPIVIFLAFMMFISPVTYYRHYLVLIPAGALIASLGLWSTGWSERRWFLVLFFLWPSLLMVDIELDYHRDPRIELRQWYAEHPDSTVFAGYYVSPPPQEAVRTVFFQPEYTFGEGETLSQADYLILSENWYDTAFANELNGPYIARVDRLIKTKPEYVRFYRQALSGSHLNLQLATEIDVENFMPELVIHKWLYGTFQLFVGDLKIFRIAHQ